MTAVGRARVRERMADAGIGPCVVPPRPGTEELAGASGCLLGFAMGAVLWAVLAFAVMRLL